MTIQSKYATASFNGDRTKWKSYDMYKQAEAKLAIPGTPNGILGFWLSTPEWTLLNLGAHVALVHPGPRPVNVPGATGVQSQAHSADAKTWDYLNGEYVKQEEAISKFKGQLKEESSAVVLRAIENPITGLMTLSLREIRVLLKATYGQLSPMDVDKLNAEANAYYQPGSDMLDFINTRKSKFAEIAATGEIFCPETLTRSLIVSLNGHFKDVVKFWRDMYTTPALQNANVEVLNSALVRAYDESKLITPDVTRHGMNEMQQFAKNFEARLQAAEAGIALGVSGVSGVAAAAAASAKSKLGVSSNQSGPKKCKVCGTRVTDKGATGRTYNYCSTCYANYNAAKVLKGT